MDKSHGMIALALAAACGSPAAQDARGVPAVPASQAAQREAAQREDVRREVEEASRAIEAYSAARRQEAVERARLAVERMDARLARLRTAWSRERDGLAADARAARDRVDADLRLRRERLETRYRALRTDGADADAEAWARVKADFVQAYRELGDALGGGHGADRPASDRDGAPERDDAPAQQEHEREAVDDRDGASR